MSNALNRRMLPGVRRGPRWCRQDPEESDELVETTVWEQGRRRGPRATVDALGPTPLDPGDRPAPLRRGRAGDGRGWPRAATRARMRIASATARRSGGRRVRWTGVAPRHMGTGEDDETVRRTVQR